MSTPGVPAAPAAARPARTRKIVYSFLLVMVFMGLVPVGVVARKLIDISREALVTSQQQAQLQVAASMVRQMDASVAATRDEMGRLARTFESLAPAGRSGGRSLADAGRDLLGRLLEAGFLLVRYAPASGPTLQAGRPEIASAPEALAAVRDGIRAAAQGGFTASDPFVVRTPQGDLTAVALSVPAGREGVLTGLLDFAALWDPVARGRRSGYTLYALDREGRLLASQDDEGVLAGDEYQNFGVVQEFRRARGRSAVTTEFSLQVNGRPVDYLASFDTTAQGWGVFVQLEKTQAYAAVNQMIQTTMVWASVAVGLALVLAYLLAATVTRPIKTLAEGTQAFARGAFDHRVEVSSRNELGELAVTFNAMAQQIQEYIQRLSAAARLNSELFMGTIRALAEAIDEKDPYTRGHSERVNRYAVLLAKQMGLNRKQIREVHIASLFHDIGKIGIEDKILRKPAGLTDDEYTVMKQHPEKGAQMLSKIAAMRDIIPGIRFHHERWDGTGYPLSLKGEQIPLSARIVAVADAFDAMTTNRPYQKAMPFEKAIARLFELSDRVFDRTVVTAFAEAHRRGSFVEPQVAVAAEQ